MSTHLQRGSNFVALKHLPAALGCAGRQNSTSTGKRVPQCRSWAINAMGNFNIQYVSVSFQNYSLSRLTSNKCAFLFGPTNRYLGLVIDAKDSQRHSSMHLNLLHLGLADVKDVLLCWKVHLLIRPDRGDRAIDFVGVMSLVLRILLLR